MMKATTLGKWGKTAAAAALLGSIIAGCGNPSTPSTPSNSPSPSANPDNTTGAGGPSDHPPVTLDMMVETHPNWPYREDWLVYEYIKEATNIEFNVEAPPNSYSTAVNLAISSGDLPDIMTVRNVASANSHGDSGAFVNIFDHLDEMPNYKQFLEDNPEVRMRVLSADGKSYFFPLYGLDRESRRSWLYRSDIFEKHNLEVPSTYDELHEVLIQLKELYPDSIPLTLFGGLSPLGNMAPNFGVSQWQYYDYDTEEWGYGPIQDNYKVMLTYLNKFYEEGLIPPDFLSIQRKQFNDLFVQEKSFMVVDYVGSIDTLVPLVKEDNPDFQLKFMPPPAGGPDGVQENEHPGFVPNGFAISTTSNNKEAAFRYMDFLYSPEGVDLISWGKEGETYIVEDGVRKISPEYASFGDLRTKTGIATFGAYTVLDMEGFFGMFSPEMREGLEEIEDYTITLQPVVALTEQENEIINITGESVKKHMDENISKFIVGQRSLDEWDAYVAEMERLGVDQFIDVYKEAHERAKSFLE